MQTDGGVFWLPSCTLAAAWTLKVKMHLLLQALLQLGVQAAGRTLESVQARQAVVHRQRQARLCRSVCHLLKNTPAAGQPPSPFADAAKNAGDARPFRH